jgi:hypothetical protein
LATIRSTEPVVDVQVLDAVVLHVLGPFGPDEAGDLFLGQVRELGLQRLGLGLGVVALVHPEALAPGFQAVAPDLLAVEFAALPPAEVALLLVREEDSGEHHRVPDQRVDLEFARIEQFERRDVEAR